MKIKPKYVALFGAVMLVTSILIGDLTDNWDFAGRICSVSILCLIASLIMWFISDERRIRVYNRRAEYKKQCEEIERQIREKQRHEAELAKYETLWKDVEILDIERKSRKAYLIYSATIWDGTVETYRTKINYFWRRYDLTKIIAAEHIGNFTKGWLRPFSAEIPLFIITYYDGSKQIIKVKEGSEEYRDLLSFEGKSPREVQSRVKNGKTLNIADTYNKAYSNETAYGSISSTEFNYNISSSPHNLETNDLPQGEYLIGKDIPVGTYDFFVVYGYGGKFDLAKYDENGKIITGTWKQFHWVGLKESYENRELIHIHCEDGYTIKISGNVIMRIVKSQEIKIEL